MFKLNDTALIAISDILENSKGKATSIEIGTVYGCEYCGGCTGCSGGCSGCSGGCSSSSTRG